MATIDITAQFNARIGALDHASIAALVDGLTDAARSLTRRGAVVGVSGGVDSATCAMLAGAAFGPERVALVHLPDRDSSDLTSADARAVAETVGTDLIHRDITEVIQSLGVYDDLREVVVSVLGEPQSGAIAKWKLVRTPPSAKLPVRYQIHAISGSGQGRRSRPLTSAELTFVVSRMNVKQRIRMLSLYSVADQRTYMVVGTANRVELRTGFFVRYGDGSGDHFPISGFYKTEVRRLAKTIGLPSPICERVATTDNFSAEQSQEEFFFGLPEREFDLLLYGYEQGCTPKEIATAIDYNPAIVEGVFADLSRRKPYLQYLFANPLEGLT